MHYFMHGLTYLSVGLAKPVLDRYKYHGPDQMMVSIMPGVYASRHAHLLQDVLPFGLPKLYPAQRPESVRL